MKIFPSLVTPIIISSIFILSSCSPKETPEVKEFEKFMVQVEHSVKDKEMKDWSTVEQEFDQRWNKVEDMKNELGDETAQELDKLKGRYETLKDEWQDNSDNAKEELRASMNELNGFLRKIEIQASEVSHDATDVAEMEYNELKRKVKQAADSAGEDVSSAMEGIEERFVKIKSSWTNEMD